jgi:uncharacterized protein (DUF433 family)
MTRQLPQWLAYGDHIFRQPYQGLTPEQIRAAIDQETRSRIERSMARPRRAD